MRGQQWKWADEFRNCVPCRAGAAQEERAREHNRAVGDAGVAGAQRGREQETAGVQVQGVARAHEGGAPERRRARGAAGARADGAGCVGAGLHHAGGGRAHRHRVEERHDRAPEPVHHTGASTGCVGASLHHTGGGRADRHRIEEWEGRAPESVLRAPVGYPPRRAATSGFLWSLGTATTSTASASRW